MSSPVLKAGSDLEQIWDRQLETHLLRLLPGDCYVSREAEVLTTVLGSCVSACVRDTELGCGGMNHFMLPSLPGGGGLDPSSLGRYGEPAMEGLIEGILQLGGQKDRLEVKVFGGGNIVAGMSDVGEQNIKFIQRYLGDLGLNATAQDLGLAHPRKIIYFVDTGKVMVKRLRALHSRAIVAEEQKYTNNMAAA